tara:strand:+ start:366 stop:620 length:255 start_codon:yes stop_codon:yes gene_type:complete
LKRFSNIVAHSIFKGVIKYFSGDLPQKIGSEGKGLKDRTHKSTGMNISNTKKMAKQCLYPAFKAIISGARKGDFIHTLASMPPA